MRSTNHEIVSIVVIAFFNPVPSFQTSLRCIFRSQWYTLPRAIACSSSCRLHARQKCRRSCRSVTANFCYVVFAVRFTPRQISVFVRVAETDGWHDAVIVWLMTFVRFSVRCRLNSRHMNLVTQVIHPTWTARVETRNICLWQWAFV